MSVAAVQARIAEIQSRLAPPRPAGTAGGFQAALTAASADLADPSALMKSAGTVTAPAVGWSPRPPAVSGGQATHNHSQVDPPADLKPYGNGKIPPGALASIGDGGHRMWAPAGAAFNQMRADAAKAGVTFGVTDSYRSYDQQVDLARRKGLYSQGGLAATPGTSNHGWGLSLDLDLDPKAQAWMRANGEKYGFVEDVPREPWHWTFQGTETAG